MLTKPLHTLAVWLTAQQQYFAVTQARGKLQPCYNTQRLQMSPPVEMYSAPGRRPSMYTPSRWTSTVRCKWTQSFSVQLLMRPGSDDGVRRFEGGRIDSTPIQLRNVNNWYAIWPLNRYLCS